MGFMDLIPFGKHQGCSIGEILEELADLGLIDYE